mgnify:CR=1 FL=1
MTEFQVGSELGLDFYIRPFPPIITVADFGHVGPDPDPTLKGKPQIRIQQPTWIRQKKIKNLFFFKY